MYSTQTDIHSKSSIKANDVQARKALSEKGPGNEPIVGELRSIVKVDGSRCLCFKAGIEKTTWVFQGCAFKKIHLHMVFEAAHGTDHPAMSPHCRVPFPFLDDVRIRRKY
jgi:hypothetical protein